MKKTLSLLITGVVLINACSDDPPPAPPNDVTDTTSHDFLWTTYYLGDAQSHLQDVFAINDSDVWAVGEIYLRDSTGALNKKYNAAHFDGAKWVLIAKYNPICGTPDSLITPFVTVFGIGQDAIWLTNGGMVQFFNGASFVHDCSILQYLKGTTTKIWGNSSDNLFFVGTNGSITHWDGVKFTRMESGTQQELLDISGLFRGRIYACGGTFRGFVLEYDGTNWKQIDSLSDVQIGRWSVFARDDFFAVGGHDLRYIDIKYGDTLRTPPRTVSEGGLGNGRPIVTTSIRGSSRRNVFAVGGWQYVIHYNGKSWKWYEELWDLTGPTQYSVGVTENNVFIVGYKDGKATILHGRRSK